MHRRSFIAALGALPIMGKWLAPRPALARPLTATAWALEREARRDAEVDYWQASYLRSTADTVEQRFFRFYGTFGNVKEELHRSMAADEACGYRATRAHLVRGPASWTNDGAGFSLSFKDSA